MSVDPTRFRDRARCRVILIEFLSRQLPGLWIPLAEVREGTEWSTDQAGVRSLHSTVQAAVRDGLVEFKSGEYSGRASVRLRVITPPVIPAKENT